MIRETCAAEATHALLILAGLGLLAIWPGAGGIVLYLIYAIFGNLVFLQFRNSPEITGGTYIDHQHDRQLPFFLEDLHIRTVVAGSHIPVDIPDIVAVLIFSYLTESHTSPLKGRMIFAGKNIFGQAPGFNLYLPDPL